MNPQYNVISPEMNRTLCIEFGYITRHNGTLITFFSIVAIFMGLDVLIIACNYVYVKVKDFVQATDVWAICQLTTRCNLLISCLKTRLQEAGCQVLQAEEDTDVLIVSYTTAEAEKGH